LEEVRTVLIHSSTLLGLQTEASAETKPTTKASGNGTDPQKPVTKEPPSKEEKPPVKEKPQNENPSVKEKLAKEKTVEVPIAPANQKQPMQYRYIDLTNLMELSGGDPQFIDRILGRIVDKLPDSIQELVVLHEQADYDAMKKSAHSLKSSSGYAGSEELKEIFQKIESLAGSRNELQRLPDLLGQARHVGAEVVKELKHAIGRD
jgi:two-component system sensor histidine kinase/response regulator